MNQSDINKITASVLRGFARSFTKAKDIFASKRGFMSKSAVDIVGTVADAFNYVAKNIEKDTEPNIAP